MQNKFLNTHRLRDDSARAGDRQRWYAGYERIRWASQQKGKRKKGSRR